MQAEISSNPDLAALLKTGKVPPPPARLLPRPQDLMRIAKPILSWNRGSVRYEWKTTNAMFILRQMTSGERLYNNWFERDLKSGRERRLIKLLVNNDAISFSPDGNLALFIDDSDDRKVTWKAVAVDSNRVLRGAVPSAILKRYLPPYLDATSWTWAPDNRHWIWAPEALGDNILPVVVFSLNSSSTREVKVAVQNKGELLPSIILGFISPNRVLSTSGTSQDKSSTRSDLFEFDISKPTAKSRRIDVVLPVVSKAQAFLSPRGNRLAWLLQVEDGERDFVELWLSRSDGSQMRGVGETEMKSQANLNSFRLDSLQWRPDGKQLTFINNQKMYAVNVPN